MKRYTSSGEDLHSNCKSYMLIMSTYSRGLLKLSCMYNKEAMAKGSYWVIPLFTMRLKSLYIYVHFSRNKDVFIIFRSHAQLKELDPYPPDRIFGNLVHSAVGLNNLVVWFDDNFSFADHVRNICKTCFIQIRDLRWFRQYLTDEAAILMANALVSSCLDYATLSSGICPVLTCANHSVFKTHLLGLPQTVTNTQGHILCSNNCISSQLNFAVSSKLAL